MSLLESIDTAQDELHFQDDVSHAVVLVDGGLIYIRKGADVDRSLNHLGTGLVLVAGDWRPDPRDPSEPYAPVAEGAREFANNTIELNADSIALIVGA